MPPNEPPSDSPEYRCPHCDAVLTTVRVVESVPVSRLAPRKRVRGPYKVTPELLAAVLETFDGGGVPAIQARWHVSERTARRYLAEARNGN